MKWTEKIWEVYLKDGKIKEPKKKDMEVNNEKIFISLVSLLVFTSCVLHVYRFTLINYNNSKISISTGLVDAQKKTHL